MFVTQVTSVITGLAHTCRRSVNTHKVNTVSWPFEAWIQYRNQYLVVCIHRHVSVPPPRSWRWHHRLSEDVMNRWTTYHTARCHNPEERGIQQCVRVGKEVLFVLW